MTFIISTLFNIRPTFIFCGRFICRKKQRRGLQYSGLTGLGRLITVLHCLYTEWTSSTVPQDTNQILSVANTQRRVLIIYGSFLVRLTFSFETDVLFVTEIQILRELRAFDAMLFVNYAH